MWRETAVLSSSLVVLMLGGGCGGATRSASPRSADSGPAIELTSARANLRFERVLVGEKGRVAMVARDGCVATIGKAGEEAGGLEELRIRCPRPDRMKAWFAAVDRITANVVVESADEDAEDVTLPSAELVTKKGVVMHVKRRADAESLLGEVRALTEELASAEMPSPGPRSAGGWQMLRVAGPAHVVLGGSPTAGVLEARMSTSGQYLCEFVANKERGPVRATKSGWITPTMAARAIDDVLGPFADVSAPERRPATYVVAVTGGAERRANTASTAAVFQRFARVQDALGDACLPELDPPTTQIGL